MNVGISLDFDVREGNFTRFDFDGPQDFRDVKGHTLKQDFRVLHGIARVTVEPAFLVLPRIIETHFLQDVLVVGIPKRRADRESQKCGVASFFHFRSSNTCPYLTVKQLKIALFEKAPFTPNLKLTLTACSIKIFLLNRMFHGQTTGFVICYFPF